MIAWFWNLIVGQFCCHQWNTIGEGQWSAEDGAYGPRFTLQCKKCGQLKGVRIR